VSEVDIERLRELAWHFGKLAIINEDGIKQREEYNRRESIPVDEGLSYLFGKAEAWKEAASAMLDEITYEEGY
jgi:hypothetical protein